MSSNEVAVQAPVNLPAPVQGRVLLRSIGLSNIAEQQREIRAIIRDHLVAGRDYGAIPGTQKRDKLKVDGTPDMDERGYAKKEEKKSLYKPGAEKVAAYFNLYPVYEVQEKTIDHTGVYPWRKVKKEWVGVEPNRKQKVSETEGESTGLYRYVIVCKLMDRGTGEVMGMHPAVCSSMEAKYTDRPREVENTVYKMACKRALVAVVLNVFGLSDEFTQDLEDDPENEEAITKRELETEKREERKKTGFNAVDSLEESENLTLPGEKSERNPHGGKALRDVPSNVLRKAMKELESKDIESLSNVSRNFMIAAAWVLEDRQDKYNAQQAEILRKAEEAKANALAQSKAAEVAQTAANTLPGMPVALQDESDDLPF